jgi:hypothetical protein
MLVENLEPVVNYFLNAQIDSLLLLFHLSTLLEKVSDDNDSVHPD